MIERITIFLILGFFVFGPQIQSFWSHAPLSWFHNYVVWLGLIAACFWSQVRESRTPRN